MLMQTFTHFIYVIDISLVYKIMLKKMDIKCQKFLFYKIHDSCTKP